jgi:hypothetical protein
MIGIELICCSAVIIPHLFNCTQNNPVDLLLKHLRLMFSGSLSHEDASDQMIELADTIEIEEKFDLDFSSRRSC